MKRYVDSQVLPGKQSRMLTSLLFMCQISKAVLGVPKIKDGYNPATWMLEVSSPAMEVQLDVDFAQIYANSTLYQ